MTSHCVPSGAVLGKRPVVGTCEPGLCQTSGPDQNVKKNKALQPQAHGGGTAKAVRPTSVSVGGSGTEATSLVGLVLRTQALADGTASAGRDAMFRLGGPGSSQPEQVLHEGECLRFTGSLSDRRFSLSKVSAQQIQQALELELLQQECKVSTMHRSKGFKRAIAKEIYVIDKLACSTLSQIIRAKKLTVDEATQFVRGEVSGDRRPNKALNPDRLRLVLQGYPHLDSLIAIAEVGIDVRWDQGPKPRRPPCKNHGSCRRYLRAVTRSIREGQDSGQYMVVDADILEQWPDVVCSPLGAVEKKDADPSEEVRTIHDLSYPRNESVNDAFIAESVPKVRYESVTIIARRIEYLANHGHAGRIRILKGDVKGAFRHLRTRADQVFRMAAYVKELGILIIDMAAPFGWSGSPPCYALFGRAISWLVGSNSPASVSDAADENPFFPYEWVDDHILVEPDVDDRLQLAEATLRHAMLAVLGPRSINEAKFSPWAFELVALGLRWNTARRTVSIPSEKVSKARTRVKNLIKKDKASKTEFYKVLGSLRHVAVCLRTAKPFYQRLQTQCNAAPRFGCVPLSSGSAKDLIWFGQILSHGYLAELPLAMFGALPAPDVELYMDASNIGLAILDPASNNYIQTKFDGQELQWIDQVGDCNTEFSINVREHLCISIALWTWGARWHQQACGRLVHVKCWSDNKSAVCWSNKLQSSNIFSQEINRAIGLAEAYFNLRVSADHLPGSSNTMADAASRAWTEPYLTRWTNFSLSWSQTLIPKGCRKTYTQFSSNFSPDRWPRHQLRSIAVLKNSGASGAGGLVFRNGFPKNRKSTHTNSRYLPPIAGLTDGRSQYPEMLLVPCSPRSARSRGIIEEPSAIQSGFSPDTSLQSPECAVPTHPTSQSPQLLSPFSGVCTSSSILQKPRTESFGGASVLGFFFLLRRSEYLALGGKVQPYAIQRADVTFVGNDGNKVKKLEHVLAVIVRFRGSKADQFGEGETRRLERSGFRWCCPVRAAWYLVEHHKSLGIAETTLLCRIDANRLLQVRQVVDVIKGAANQAGQEPERYGSHSLRSGGASALFNAGFDSLAVKLFGRWKSDAVERYTRIGGRLTSKMAHEMMVKPAILQNVGVSATPLPGSGFA